jgi:type I restriction enzyme, S subunit
MGEEREIPRGWELVKLGEIASYVNGKAFKPSEWSKEGLPIIRIQNLNREESQFNYCNFPVDEKYYVEKGDLLFAWSGTPDTSFGAHIWSGIRAVLNQHIFRIIIDETKITKQYYLYALNHKIKEFVSKAHGTAGLAHITKKKFEESTISLPPLPEQHRIVVKIEELFSSLDKGIETLKTARQQLKVYRPAVLKWAFEGKLTNKNVVDGELPEGWKWVTFSQLVISSQNGISKRSSKVGRNFKVLRLSDISLLSIDNKSPRNIRLLEGEVDKYKLYEGDLVCIRVNGSKDLVGRFILTKERDDQNDWAFCDHFIRFTLEPRIVSAGFYFYYFQVPTVRKYVQENMVSSAGQNTVSQGTIKSVMVPLPPVPEQHAIVSEIESRLSVCDKIEESIEQSLKQAESLRQSILKKAFEGKLVPQDSNDEPANVLLDRIKAEREWNKPEARQLYGAGKAKKLKDAHRAKEIMEAGG